jgi:hydrogenase nickel incorporation protein HypA/HybF
MHEMGIASQIVRIALEHLPPDQDLRVRALKLRIGKLTAIVPQSLRFCLEILTRETALAGAEVVIEEVPVRAVCQECGATSEISEPPFWCSACQGVKLDILSGRELLIDSLEVDEQPE